MAEINDEINELLQETITTEESDTTDDTTNDTEGDDSNIKADREEALLGEIRRLSEVVLQLQSQTSTPTPAPAAPPEVPTFIADDNALDAVLRSGATLNDVLRQVYSKALEAARSYYESASAGTVQKALSEATKHITAQETKSDFYNDNADLRPYKQMVAYVASNLVREDANKNLTLVDLLMKAGTQVREMLHLKATTTSQRKRTQPKVSDLVGQQGSAGLRSVPKKEKTLEEEVADWFAPATRVSNGR